MKVPTRSSSYGRRMVSHAPPDYECPFCHLAAGRPAPRVKREHVLERDAEVTVFMSPLWWGEVKGNVLVIPSEHYENLYELPPALGSPITAASQRAARAMKDAFGCEGVSTRQHNEPAGNQEVWHYHLHVFPRFKGDHLYKSSAHPAPEDELMEMTERLRAAWPS